MITLCDFRAKNRTEGTVCIGDIDFDAAFLLCSKRTAKLFQQYSLIQCLFQLKVVYLLRIKYDLLLFIRVIQNQAQVKLHSSFRKLLLHLQKIGTSYQFINRPDTKFCHVLTKFLSDKSHKVDDILRFSFETLSKLRILCCNTYRAGIEITYTHHDASHCYKWSCGKTKFLCTKNCCNGNITSCHQLTVCLDTHFISQSILNQCLVGLSQTKLPRKSRIVDRALWCRSCTSVVTGNQHDLCACLCNTCCNRTDTSLGNKLHTDSCILVGIL